MKNLFIIFIKVAIIGIALYGIYSFIFMNLMWVNESLFYRLSYVISWFILSWLFCITLENDKDDFYE